MACADERAMPTHVQWEPDFSVGHELIDTQHRNLLTQCNLLADHCLGEASEDSDRRFDQSFDRFKALAREHFEAEESVLSSGGFPDLEDHRIECDEFEYLVGEVATTENFDRPELQRFLALWWVGHIRGSAGLRRAFFAGGKRSA